MSRRKLFRTHGTTYVEAPAGTKFYLRKAEMAPEEPAYLASGHYVGLGEPMYEFESASRVNGEWITGHFRARNRRQAKAIMRKLFDQPTFFS